MFLVSKDTPAHYFTTVTKDRLPVFRTDTIKQITCSALNEARTSCGFLLFAYVIMPDHLHFITDSTIRPSRILQFANGIISKRVIDHLKNGNFETSLAKLRSERKARQWRYSLWDHHNNTFSITSTNIFMQKIHYIHQNPIRVCLVDRAETYRWSSIRCWNKNEVDDEPLQMDIAKIHWQGGVASEF